MKLHIQPEMGLIKKIPIGYARKFEAVPCTANESERVLVVSKETPQEIIDEMMRLTGIWKYETRSSQEVLELIDRAYEMASDEGDYLAANGLDSDIFELKTRIEESPDLLDSQDEAPIIKFANSMFFRAIRLKASDIHFEPYENEFVVRNRIDGVLYNVVTLPRGLHAPVVSRIKVMANLDIAEKRLPQDGRIKVRLGGRDIDMRVSIVPTSFGERVVLKIIDRSSLLTEAVRFFKRLFIEDFPGDTYRDTVEFHDDSAEEGEKILSSLKLKSFKEGAPGDSTLARDRMLADFISKHLHPREPKPSLTQTVKDLLRKWDCQELPLSLFDFVSFKDRYGEKGALEVLIGIEEEKMKYVVPKVSSVSTGYMVGGKLPRVDFDVVAFGFRNREYTEEALVIWAADFITGKVLDRVKLEHFENRCRLLSLEKSLTGDQLVKWVVFEGKVDDATLSYASSCGIFLTHTKQLKILFNIFGVEETPLEENIGTVDLEEYEGKFDPFAIDAEGHLTGESVK